MIVLAPLGTPILWIVSRSDSIAKALSAMVELFLGEAIPSQFHPDHVVVLSSASSLHAQFANQTNADLFNSVCLIDLASYPTECLWALENDSHPLRPTELVTRYPEVYWIFIVSHSPPLPPMIQHSHIVPISELCRVTQLLRRHVAGFRTLYDPTGFKHFVLHGEPLVSYGISCEDEVSYCLLNAYHLYRNGFGTYLACTRAEFDQCCQLICENADRDAQTTPGNTQPDPFTKLPSQRWVIAEDIELQYPDVSRDDPIYYNLLIPKPNNNDGIIALLNRRSAQYKFDACFRRIIISSLLLPTAALKRNPRILRVTKPYSGFYDSSLAMEARTPVRRWRPGNGAHHSALGVHQEIASHLISRCKRTLDDANTPEEAIQIAVLANTAGEMLGDKTLHMSLDALSLQHRMEVQAECTFVGTSNRFDVRMRMGDIEARVTRLVEYSRWFDPRVRWSSKGPKRRRQRGNAMLEICGTLRKVYDDHNQRDEEELVLTKFRKWERISSFSQFDGVVLSRRWWFFHKPWLLLCQLATKCFICPLRGYFNTLIRGPMFLLALSLMWIALFAGGYRWVTKDILREEVARFDMTFRSYMKLSATIFVSLQPAMEDAIGVGQLAKLLEKDRDEDRAKRGYTQTSIVNAMHWYYALILSEITLGYVHLGALISLLLERASRK